MSPPPPPPLLWRPPPSPTSLSLSPSLLIIAGIILFVILASLSIHLLLRLLSATPSLSSSSRVVSFSPQSPSSLPHAEAPTPNSHHSNCKTTTADALIQALPIFTLASIPKSSHDCAVCLSPFDPTANLRLLPACRHAFHADCIDTWLRSTASCPLCRASVRLPFPPLPVSSGNDRSRSFRVEIGSISSSRRIRNEENANNVHGSGRSRSYSLGSFDYLVEDVDIEAVVSRISRMKEDQKVEEAPAAVPPGENIAEVAGEGNINRGGWLREYVDRIASSASSSFNSLRFSGRWSARWSHRGESNVAPVGDSRRWDVEAGNGNPGSGDEATFYAIYRWISGI